MDKELARQKVEWTGKRHEEAFRELQKEPLFQESTDFTKHLENRKMSRRYDLVCDAENKAHQASWAAVKELNELYLHLVTEAGTQTDGIDLTG
jgi:hypothetical protein